MGATRTRFKGARDSTGRIDSLQLMMRSLSFQLDSLHRLVYAEVQAATPEALVITPKRLSARAGCRSRIGCCTSYARSTCF